MKLLKRKEYYERYIEYRRQGFLCSIAWEKTQNDFEQENGEVEHRGFSSFESFSTSVSRWIKLKLMK